MKPTSSDYFRRGAEYSNLARLLTIAITINISVVIVVSALFINRNPMAKVLKSVVPRPTTLASPRYLVQTVSLMYLFYLNLNTHNPSHFFLLLVVPTTELQTELKETGSAGL